MAASVCTADDDSCKDGEQSSWVSSTATATVFVGAITGQLTVLICYCDAAFVVVLKFSVFSLFV